MNEYNGDNWFKKKKMKLFSKTPFYTEFMRH